MLSPYDLMPRRSAIAGVLLILYVPACMSWQVGTPTPAQFVERERPETVRVTRTDGTTLMLSSPAVEGDSLAGTVAARGAPPDTTETVKLALTDVRSVAVRRTSLGKTLLLAIPALLVTVYVIECAGATGWEAIACP